MHPFRYLLIFLLFTVAKTYGQDFRQRHKALFEDPPVDCRVHTRWWWPGNATSKENITYELEQMSSHGIGGVEQITMSSFYEKGNIPYLSGEFMELVKHTVKEAKRLGIEVSFNFGGPGWVIGGSWVSDKDKSKDLIPVFMEVEGPEKLNSTLPDSLIRTNRSWEIFYPTLKGDEKLIAAVAGKIVEGKLDASSLTVVTDRVKDGKIKWQVPDGKWKIMFFWLATDRTHNTLDHFDKDAVQRYCEYLGGKFKDAVGDEFGKTVESFFIDSFELPYLASGIKWTDGLLQKFREQMGYDLTRYLPAIWWDAGDITPKIRYDVNYLLSKVGEDAFFRTFLGWCHANGVKGRIQPYGFETDIIQSAGMTDIPEMEITPGEKDQHPWFDTRIGPKKYVASGAHIYGKNIVSVEANTFLHWERYRATMEEIKIASDGFLRSGANKFYTHGYSSSPERDLAPSRRTGWATQLNPTNTWWKYYPYLNGYIARCSYLLRQGEFAPDVAVYSPLANQWTKNVLNARRWTRDFDWGDLGYLMISNGYDFDLLNDDAIQNIASFKNGDISIRNLDYKVLLIPDIEALPLKSLKKISEYASSGGTVVALDRLPGYSTGFTDYEKKDSEVRQLVKELFGDLNGRSTEYRKYGRGKVYFLKKVIHREIWWDQYASVFDPFLKILHSCIPPDFDIDFNYYQIRKNNGLSFYHRKTDYADIYFVSNIQDKPVDMKVGFRVGESIVWRWDPYTGKVFQLFEYEPGEGHLKVPVKLAPWESTIYVFEKGMSVEHVTKTNADRIVEVTGDEVAAEVSKNGDYFFDVQGTDTVTHLTREVYGVPSPLVINGEWNLVLESDDFERVEKKLGSLELWTGDEKTKHFSGTGKYTVEFDLPEEYWNEDLRLMLDAGKVGNVGEIWLNGKKAGVVWMKGQTCDITDLARPGLNELTVFVTNTNINRVSGFKEITPVPEELRERYGGTRPGTPLPREFGFEPLPPSGLMGPVVIKPFKRIEVKMNNN